MDISQHPAVQPRQRRSLDFVLLLLSLRCIYFTPPILSLLSGAGREPGFPVHVSCVWRRARGYENKRKMGVRRVARKKKGEITRSESVEVN